MSGHTRLVLDAQALAHNYRVLRSKTAPQTALLGVSKLWLMVVTPYL